jgi:hypothetical protein
MGAIYFMSHFLNRVTVRKKMEKPEGVLAGSSWKMYLLILRGVANEAGIQQAKRCRNKSCLLHCSSAG